ncbi:hypothetical protein HYX07_03770 [Candidatus Woesearchaeota archaeon]|nr:hypothetical protein [Candidatus Woesearchaeota archaeon]
MEKSLVIIKPDGVERSLVAHTKKPFFKELVEFITEGPVVAFVVEGVHAVDNVRRLVGDTSPHKAAPGTIRGDFAHLSMEYASKKGLGGKNVIHASGSKAEADEEI